MPEPPISMQLVARFRVALGWVAAPLVFIVADPTTESLAWGTAIALGGEAIRLWAAGHINKSREITSSGPYRYFAHPLYVGSSLMGAGLAVASGSPIAAALIALYLLVTFRAAVKNEEAYLRRLFGDEYGRYRRNGAPGRARRFSFARVMANREYRAVAGLLIAILLLALKATYNRSFWRPAGP